RRVLVVGNTVTYASKVWYIGILEGVELDDGYCPRRFAKINVHGAGNGSDGSDLFRDLASQSIAHKCAVGHARGIHPAAVDRQVSQQRIDQRADKTHVVDMVVHGITTATAGVPGADIQRAGDP